MNRVRSYMILACVFATIVAWWRHKGVFKPVFVIVLADILMTEGLAFADARIIAECLVNEIIGG